MIVLLAVLFIIGFIFYNALFIGAVIHGMYKTVIFLLAIPLIVAYVLV